MKKLAPLLLTLPMAVALFAGCQTLLGIELLDESPAPDVGSDAGPDVSAEASGEAAADAVAEEAETEPEQCDPKCTTAGLARSPCRPAANTEGESLAEPLVFAVMTLAGGLDPTKPDDWSSLGLDIDCLATNAQGEPASCVQEPDASGKHNAQDGDGGRDNGFGSVIGRKVRDVSTMFGKNIEAANNTGLKNGVEGMLFVIENYNGKADDPTLSLSVLMAGGSVDGDGGSALPVWKGTDIWSVERTSLNEDAGTAIYRDDNAYVRGHLLVAKLPGGIPITIHAEAAEVKVALTTATVHLPLSEELTYVTNGVISGVWPKAQAAEAMSRLVEGLGACPGQPAWNVLDQAIIDAVDIRENGQADPLLPCQGISFALGVNAVMAKRGPVVDPPPPKPSPCDKDAGLDAAPE